MEKHSWRDYYWASMEDLIGKTFTEVIGGEGDVELKLVCEEGTFTFYHEQDCCEHVYLEDVVGELSYLVDSPILMAEESSRTAGSEECYESGTWTFYKLATRKGYVDLRWLGTSNGYYSEGVSLKFQPKE